MLMHEFDVLELRITMNVNDPYRLLVTHKQYK